MFHFTFFQITIIGQQLGFQAKFRTSTGLKISSEICLSLHFFRIATGFDLLPLGGGSSEPRVSSKICVSLLSAGLPPKGGSTGGAPRAQQKIKHHELQFQIGAFGQKIPQTGPKRTNNTSRGKQETLERGKSNRAPKFKNEFLELKFEKYYFLNFLIPLGAGRP